MERSDTQVEGDVREALFRDGRLEPREISVSVHKGWVTLRGTVGTPRQKRIAKDVASRSEGIAGVDSFLRVEVLDRAGRRDAELRAQVLDALHADALLPDGVDADVRFGVVTLTGRVRDMLQRDEAERIARGVHGVGDVRNELSVESRPVAERWLR
jgi:osmotically-inducible protein OsmY